MRLGIFARTFPGDAPGPVLEAVRAAGYASAQYNWTCAGIPSMPDAVPPDALAATRDAVAASGVTLCALSGTFNMIHPDPAVREAGLARLDTVLASAAALGVPLVTLCTGTRDPDDQWRAHPGNDTPAAWSDLMVSMERAVASAETHDVALGVEPELANTVNTVDKAARLLAACGPRVRIVLDPANLFEVANAKNRRRLVERALDTLGPRIALAHAKDRLPDGTFTTAGRGVIDWDHYLGALRAAGFDGALVTHGLDAAEAAGVARFLGERLARA